MLTLTPAAAAALSAARTQAGAPESYGVRFSAEAQADAAQLSLSFVEAPRPDDAVGEEGGLMTYVAPEVDGLVGDAVVDVEMVGQESNLVIRPQPPSADATA